MLNSGSPLPDHFPDVLCDTSLGSTKKELVEESPDHYWEGCKVAWAIHRVLHYKARQYHSNEQPRAQKQILN